MKPESADVHVLAIHPDMGGPSDEDKMDDDGDEESDADYQTHLEDAWEAVEDKDKEGFIKSMTAALKACINEQME